MDTIAYGAVQPVDRTHIVFGRMTGYVAATALFALGTYLVRDLRYGFAFVGYLLGFAV
jgi:hypothetical protein